MPGSRQEIFLILEKEGGTVIKKEKIYRILRSGNFFFVNNKAG